MIIFFISFVIGFYILGMFAFTLLGFMGAGEYLFSFYDLLFWPFKIVPGFLK